MYIRRPLIVFPINDTISFVLIWIIILRWEKPVPLMNELAKLMVNQIPIPNSLCFVVP